VGKTYTPKIKPENINRQSGGSMYNLYRVFEVYMTNTNSFSMLFNQKSDAEAVADWHNDTRTWWDRLHGMVYKVRERRVYSGIQHACTTRTEGLPPFITGVESLA